MLALVLSALSTVKSWLTGSKLGRAVLLCLAIVVVAAFCYWAGHRDAAQDERRKCREQADRALVMAQESNRKQEVTHAHEIQELQTRYAQQQQQAAGVDARALADFGSGVRRLRFPVAPRCAGAATLGSPPVRVDGPPSAELAPETAEALYSIAADGDQAIRQLTALQAWARDALKLCGQQGGRQ